MNQKIHNILFFIFCIVISTSSCKEKKTETLFELTDSTATGIHFTNRVENTPDFNIFSYRNFYNGGGVATGDINNDGLADIFFTSNTGSNKLYLNKGNFTFEDISKKAGIEELGKWNTGVVMADVNADGWLDIYVCNAGYNKWKNKESNKLFINNHDLSFTEKAAAYGLDEKGYTTHAAFLDFDLDGDLDCYILNNSFIPVNTLNYSNKRELYAADWPLADFLKGGGDKLLRNDNGHFTDISKQANIYGSLIGFGLGITVADVNGDLYPDLYISNDFFERDYLYINQQNGTFKEELESRINHTSLASMGADIADINNDGYPDIFTTDMLPGDDYRLKTTSSFDNYDVYQFKLKQGFYNQVMQNALQVNNRNGSFLETANFSGVAATDWSWGALIFDADNDGQSDIYVCNGIYKDVTDQDFIDFFANDIIQKMAISGEKEDMQKIVDSMPSIPILNKAFKNKGNLKFSDEGVNWGFTQTSFSNGASYADLDNDGDLDLIINNVNMPCFVYKNTSREKAGGNYISVLLKGTGQNSFAIGSTIKIFSGNQIISREVIPSRGFQSSVDYKNVIGLGTNKIDSMFIIWPDRMITKINAPKINQLLTVDYAVSKKERVPVLIEKNNTILFEQIAKQAFDKHSEDDFVDFYQERNIPVMLSKEGPRAAVADVNGDGVEDIFISGAKGQPGKLYFYTTAGYKKQQKNFFDEDSTSEDVAVLFFDADGDGDKDIYVGPGGNNQPPRNKQLLHRLYLNNSKGFFSKYVNAFPENSSNISVAVDYDFDSDGDLDLFIGGRSLSYNYGANPISYIFENDGKGHFTDVTKLKAPAIEKIGMVTDAVWANITGDERKELVIVGEWMSPKIFSYNNGRLAEVKTTLNNMNGWWQTVKAADMDGDGKEDLVLGNLGENFYLHPDEQNPLKLWISDFDMNGVPDKILSRTIAGKDVPVFLKKEFTEVLPSFKKENLRHHAFASKTIQTLFSAEQLKNTAVKIFNYSSSCIAYNKGNGSFEIKKLPVAAQLSCINALLCKDINEDGKPDLILAGNLPDCLPQFGRLDALPGLVLMNKGGGNWKEIPAAETGINLRGITRDIKWLAQKNNSSLLFLQNNDFPVLYNMKKAK